MYETLGFTPLWYLSHRPGWLVDLPKNWKPINVRDSMTMVVQLKARVLDPLNGDWETVWPGVFGA
jgi:hypothetical protein